MWKKSFVPAIKEVVLPPRAVGMVPLSRLEEFYTLWCNALNKNASDYILQSYRLWVFLYNLFEETELTEENQPSPESPNLRDFSQYQCEIICTNCVVLWKTFKVGEKDTWLEEQKALQEKVVVATLEKSGQ